MGIEVDFIKAYQSKKRHGLLGYGLAFWNALFRFHFTTFELIEQNQSTPFTPYTLMISNTNEQGYGRTLNPHATTNDGKLNLVGLPQTELDKAIFIYASNWFFKQPLQRKSLLEKKSLKFKLKGKIFHFPYKLMENT